MSYLLSVTSSTRGEQSWSNKLLSEFEEQFMAINPSATIQRRFTGDIPHLDFAAQAAGRTPLEKHSPSDTAAFALSNELTDEVIGASALVVATPMYNWVPAGPLDRGMVAHDSPESAYIKAQKQIPQAVTRIR